MRKCKNCPMLIPVPDDPMLARFLVYCPACAEARRIANEKKQTDAFLAQRESDWRQICPPIYRETQPEKLPDPAKLVKVLEWEHNRHGLILHGKTRKGKSRCAWLLARKVFFEGKSVRVLDSRSGFEYAARFSHGAERVLDYIDSHSRCGLLFLDDVFKAKLTESFEQAIFAIIENRQAFGRPILATTNDTGDTLKSRMSADRGDALIARLKEMCEVVKF